MRPWARAALVVAAFAVGGSLTRPGHLTAALAVGSAAPVLPATPAAVPHEVPADVAVQIYVHPSGNVLTALVRLPLASMRDVEFPVRGPGYLVLEQAGPALREAAELWIADGLSFFEDGRRLPRPSVTAVRVSLPSDRSFASWEEAHAHLQAPALPVITELMAGQALLDVALSVPITSAASRFSVEPALAHLGVETTSVIHFVTPDGAERAFQYRGDPGVVHLDPRWHQAFFNFVGLGFRHILEGLDHLLFVLLLVLPFRRLRPVVVIVTGFTVAHSITLLAAAAGLAPAALWFGPLVETLIALSLVYTAVENVLGVGSRRRWMLAFGFGLIHGFGFSLVLRESLQFAGAHLVTSLLAFNVGVELGQLLVVVAAVPLLNALFRRIPERSGVIVVSALAGHEAWHWMTERGTQLMQYRVRLPVWDAALAAAAVRWVMVGLICVGAAWAVSALVGRLLPADAGLGREGG